MAERKRRKRAANGQGGVYQRADGRWEAKIFVDLPDGRRKRISVYGDTQQETLNELTRMLDQQRRGIPVVTTTMTVADYMNYWLKHIAEPSIRRTTYASYEGDVRLHIIPGIGSRKLKSLQPAHVRAWLTGLQTLCQCCAQRKDAARVANSKARCCALQPARCCKDVLASSSIQHILRVLRAALQDAVDEELLNRNVARLVQLRVTEKKKVRAFTREETLRFLKTAQGHRLYALWAVALSMGLRRGEALGLGWKDVDLDAGLIKIHRALHRVDGKLQLEDVKTEGSAGVLPLPPSLVSVLESHRLGQLKERLAAGASWRDTGLVFTTASGGPIDPRSVNRMFSSLCKKAGVPQIRVHDLRHSCATLLFTMGVEAATVQKILRHSSITVTTGTYVEVIESVKRDALDSMGTLLPQAESDAGEVG